jgi:hypothetical protein
MIIFGRISSLTITIFLLSGILQLAGITLNNRYDPAPMYSPMGTDMYYVGKKNFGFGFVCSPYYQHTVTASRKDGRKVSAGNIFGNPNLFGTIWPTTDIVPVAVRSAAENMMVAQLTGLLNDPIQLITAVPTPVPVPSPAGTDNSAVDLIRDPRGAYNNIGVDYEKLGIRTQFTIDSGFGLGFSLRMGAADVKNRPQFPSDGDILDNLKNLIPPDSSTNTCVDGKDPCTFFKILKKDTREKVAKSIGLAIHDIHRVDIEDIHVGAYLHVPKKFFEKTDYAFTFLPYLSLGAWIPTSQKRNIDRAFDVALGNDGATGITLEGALGFDFPQMLQFNFGVGLLFFPEHQCRLERLPSSESQRPDIFVPWRQAVRRKPGTQWCFNVSFKADDIISKIDIPNVSFFFDYRYTQHTRDEISVADSRAARVNAFRPDIVEKQTGWKAQQMSAGLSYGLTSNVFFSIAVQGYIGGALSYRTTTILGSVVMTF